MRCSRLLPCALAIVALVCACATNPANPNADASGSETGAPEGPPTPAWSIELPGNEFWGTVQDFEVNDEGEILVAHVEARGEWDSEGSLHKLDGDGALVWSLAIDESPEHICARSGGGAFALVDGSTPEDDASAPILLALDADGALEWTVDVEVPTPPTYNDVYMACERDADGVFVTGSTGEGDAFLVRYDSAGAAGVWIEPLFGGDMSDEHAPTGIRVTDTGELLVGARGRSSGAPDLHACVSLVRADGTVDLHTELGPSMAQGPFLAVRGGAWASAGQVPGSTPTKNSVRVDALVADLTSAWTTTEGEAASNATTRPLTIDDRGRLIAAFPNWDGELRVAVYDDQGAVELTVLSEIPGEPRALGVDGQGRLLVGGTLDPEPAEGMIGDPRLAWLAAYELSSL